MRKFIIAVILFAVTLVTVAGIAISDSGTKKVIGKTNGSVLFEYKDGALTIMNIRLR